MRKWTHDELHALMENDANLKEKSDIEHSQLRNTSEEKEQGKLKMMEIYAQAIGCNQLAAAQEYVRKVFEHLRQNEAWDELRHEYILNEWCHSPSGNDYLCFCEEKTA